MTISEALERVKVITPSGWPDELLLSWLSEVEGTLLVEVLRLDLNEVQELTEINDAELTAKHPYDKLYPMYVKAQIEFANGEYERSANSMQMFNTYWDGYAVWVLNNLRPEYGEAVRNGYYLSAFALAKQYGFKGTEEEWLQSLVGPTGPQGERGEQGPPGDGVGMFYGESGDGITYNITDENAPIVAPGSGGAWVGKGKQMLFVPRTNSGKSLQISINGKEAIPVKCRRAGGLAETLTNGISAGVPYLMTFCGLYWLIDSWIYEESGVDFKTDETLKLENGVLSVNIAGDAEQDNTLPISSAAVYTEIGNIDAILKTI